MLRLALYELEYEGLASHALDEHVDLARGVAGSASFAPAFVNGVLREAGRRAETKTLPAPEVRVAVIFDHFEVLLLLAASASCFFSCFFTT